MVTTYSSCLVPICRSCLPWCRRFKVKEGGTDLDLRLRKGGRRWVAKDWNPGRRRRAREPQRPICMTERKKVGGDTGLFEGYSGRWAGKRWARGNGVSPLSDQILRPLNVYSTLRCTTDRASPSPDNGGKPCRTLRTAQKNDVQFPRRNKLRYAVQGARTLGRFINSKRSMVGIQNSCHPDQ